MNRNLAATAANPGTAIADAAARAMATAPP